MKIHFLTPHDSDNRVHTYFTGSPYHPDNKRIVYTRFPSLRGPAHVCMLNTDTGEEEVVGETQAFWYHSGSRAWFSQSGKGLIFQSRFSWDGVRADDPLNAVEYHDLVTGASNSYASSICNYSRNIQDQFIEIDGDCAVDEQAEMAIYLRSNDGKQRQRLATVDDLLKLNPQGGSIRGSQLHLRLGGAIRPDGQQIMLFLVSRIGVLVRDYYLCNPDGTDLRFLGRLGEHLTWHPDNRHVVTFATENGCSYFPKLQGLPSMNGGRLVSYDTVSQKMTVLSDYSIGGGCHPVPSPDGTKVVLDCHRPDEIDILLYDYNSGIMEKLVTQKRDVEVEPQAGSRLDLPNGIKHYDIHAHPAWSHDSKKILFNGCPDGRVRLCEIRLD